MRRIVVVFLLAGFAVADVAVDKGGGIYKGSASVEETRVVIGRKKIPRDDVHLVETNDGKLLYAPDFENRVRGYEYLARAYLRDRYVKLVRECIQVRDIRLGKALLEAAEKAGLSSREAVKLKLRLEKAAGKGGDTSSDRLQAESRELEGYFGELLAQRAATALEGADRAGADPDALRLLREALDEAPRSSVARSLLQRLAPKGFAIGDARTWLDWHLDLELSGARITEGEEPAVTSAKSMWRSDLHGVHAAPILVVTPVTDSHMVGRCLAYGRLGCHALQQLFATDHPARRPSHALTVFLYSSREEYMTTSGTGRNIENPASLQWTAGHYNPAEGISRFFWFRDPDAERRIIGTCVHELTHHWLEELNPRVKPVQGTIVLPGYWIVEGFATFMEEGIYDVESQQWDLFNPRARTLDCLQSLGHSKLLISWIRFYRLRQGEFLVLPPDDRITIGLRWQLRPTVVSTRRLFYEQAGATCHYLYHAENGKYRERLIRYVCDYYAGRAKRLDTVNAFGLSARELGRRTVEFAKAVAGGWQPEGK